jgi:ATP-dependent exoDNAse (exonuclease V) beta subunit
MTSENDFEEERRLLYVAVTRAKENLFLLKPEEILTRGQSYEVGELSPLLADLDQLEQLVEQRIYTPQPDGGPGAGGAATEADDREQLQRIQDYFSF